MKAPRVAIWTAAESPAMATLQAPVAHNPAEQVNQLLAVGDLRSGRPGEGPQVIQ